MNRIRIAAAVFASAISISALLLAIVGGSVLLAIESLLGIITLGHGTELVQYPLGTGVLVVYACGIVLGVTALRWPVATGIAMWPLGAGAFLFGGPIAQAYGIVIVCIAAVILATGSRRAAA